MVGCSAPQRRLHDRQRAKKQSLRPRIIGHPAVDAGELRRHRGGLQIVGAAVGLGGGEGILEERPGSLVSAFRLEPRCGRAECSRFVKRAIGVGGQPMAAEQNGIGTRRDCSWRGADVDGVDARRVGDDLDHLPTDVAWFVIKGGDQGVVDTMHARDHVHAVLIDDHPRVLAIAQCDRVAVLFARDRGGARSRDRPAVW